jgi:quinol monooxygenase YgiN
MGHLEMIAHMKIRPGQLQGFKAQAAEILRLTREKDTKTLRYDWFINKDGTECEVHEIYVNEEGLKEHNARLGGEEPSFQGVRIRPPDERLRRNLAAPDGPVQEARRRSQSSLLRPGTRDVSNGLTANKRFAPLTHVRTSRAAIAFGNDRAIAVGEIRGAQQGSPIRALLVRRRYAWPTSKPTSECSPCVVRKFPWITPRQSSARLGAQMLLQEMV